MLQEVFEDDDFLQVSPARRLVNISGTVRNKEEVKVSKRSYKKKMEGTTAAPTLLWWQKLERNETKQAINFKSAQGKTYGSS
jgi:hypothetical protein